MTPPPLEITRERRAELLATAPAPAVIALAEQCVEDGTSPTVLSGPDVGMVMMTVREPIARQRFHLGEVLVTRAEVEVDGVRGWSMRVGDDRIATLAAAVLDAEHEAGRAHRDDVLELCALAEEIAMAESDREWAELQPTEVRFDELD